MTTLKSVDEAAARKGWTIISKREVKGDGVQAPGFVTLCRTDPDQVQPYVVHFFNAQDGGFHSGRYSNELMPSMITFDEQAARYTRHH